MDQRYRDDKEDLQIFKKIVEEFDNFKILFNQSNIKLEENLQKLIELIKDCNDTDFSMDELLKQTELEKV